MSSESRSNSGSDRSRSNSPNLNQGPVPTPGHGLDRSRSNSPDTANKYAANENLKVGSYTSDRSRSQSASRSRESSRSRKSSNDSKSRSNSPNSNKSWGSRRSDGSHHSNKSKPRSERSRKSRSRSVASSRSAVSSKSGSHRSRSGSGSERSKSAGSNKSRSKTPSNRSGSAGSNRSKSEGSNRSRSGDSRQSRSRSRSKSRSKSRSRSHSVAREHSAEKSRSNTPERSPSHERRSQSPPDRGSRSREGSVKRSRSREGSQTHDKSPHSPEAPHTPTGTPSRRSRSPEEGSDIERNRDDSIERSREPKKSRVIVSDSDNDDEGKAEASAAALFGDADDISSDEERDKNNENDARGNRSDDNRDERDQRSDDEHEQQPIIEEDEDKEAEEQIPETRIDVEIPKISCDLGRDIHFVKLPNFLSVETRPFDPETYEDEIDEEETLDEEGRARLKLKVENTIRWREVVDNDGNLAKESNARIVKWSDGSLSLHLGAEIFDVYKQPLQGDHNHLFIRQGTGLQGQAVFRTKLSFRPHSTESFTHRKMTLSLADRSQKTSGIKILSQVGADPDQDRKTLLKKEEEKLRQTVRVKPKKRGEGGIGRSHASNAVYREEDGSDEDGAISLNAIKNKYKAGVVNQNKGGAIYSSDEEGSDFETTRSRKQDKSKALKDSESSDDSE